MAFVSLWMLATALASVSGSAYTQELGFIPYSGNNEIELSMRVSVGMQVNRVVSGVDKGHTPCRGVRALEEDVIASPFGSNKRGLVNCKVCFLEKCNVKVPRLANGRMEPTQLIQSSGISRDNFHTSVLSFKF